MGLYKHILRSKGDIMFLFTIDLIFGTGHGIIDGIYNLRFPLFYFIHFLPQLVSMLIVVPYFVG